MLLVINLRKKVNVAEKLSGFITAGISGEKFILKRKNEI